MIPDKRLPPIIIHTKDYDTSFTLTHKRCGGTVMLIEHIRRTAIDRHLVRMRCAKCDRLSIVRITVEQIG